MIILHNPYDETSRQFVLENPDLGVVNWYDLNERNGWLASGGTSNLSAFPSVVCELVTGGNIVVRMPGSVSEAVLKKKYAEAESFIRAEDYVSAQTWIDELDGEGVDVTGLQAWLDEVKTP